ncbi:Shedu anti-phage system protein SduA domain-containing protein [Kribbella sp. CA-247076]|uniref:Shedu anti-phage system protein SduA domain-containing protein n=1 Tax=Kribbella sp. CA-247076 TaxID=3239941 RepID=UPI003D8FC22A
MNLNLEWSPPLRSRRGAPNRLRGIRVFHDFNWLDVFPDRRTLFKNGEILARTVQAQAPEGLIPALLLTRRTDVRQGFLKTETHFLFILNIDEYRQTPGNPALSYIANHLEVGAAKLREFTELAEFGDPDALRALVMRHMDVEDVVAWLNDDASRLQSLTELVEIGARSPATMDELVDSVGALGDLDERQLQQLIDLTVGLTGANHRADLLRGATSDEIGRRAAGLVLHERIADRIADARRAIETYEHLLHTDTTTETQMQKFLSKNPLLFGLEYAAIRPQTRGPSGSMDFILERFDGYNDLVELKSPADVIIKAPPRVEGSGVPSPHHYSLSSGLAQALAQALAYRDRLTRYASAAEELHGISNPRDPRLLIVLGRMDRLEDHHRLVLDELNRSVHRAQVLPYDVLAQRARAALTNILRYMGSDIHASQD